MYIDHYGFREHPFQMTPDARLFYPSSGHSRAYAHLMYGLAQKEGFVVVTGEVGAGKTTLIERLCGELNPEGFVVARIVTTQVSGDDLLRLVADAFGAPADGDKASVLRGVTGRLKRADRRHLLIVDEAQALTHAAMEELRMLSNVTEGGHAVLQTILLGQPQLRALLASPDLDQLRQRVLASYHLGALSREETHAYVEHRMRAVGWNGDPAWQEGALDLVHRFSGGIPRRINRLCSRVLLGGALEHSSVLTAPMVEATALELEEDLGGGGVLLAPRRGNGLGASISGIMLGRLEENVEELHQRMDALERQVTRRERTFSRMMDLLGEVAQSGGTR
jgi:putative secretion ATPase (PEP-CTERM system associated)